MEDGDWESGGGYMAVKKAKLEEQFQLDKKHYEKVKQSDLFKGVSIFVNGHTIPSAKELKQIMIKHGGKYSLYKSASTTHTICSQLAHSKLIKLKPDEKVVHPSWIMACLKEGKLVNTDQYLIGKDLFHMQPDEMQPSTSSKVNFDNHYQQQPPSTSKQSLQMLKTTDPNFITDFYSRSRLHHIATWGQERKDLVRKEKRRLTALPLNARFPRKNLLQHRKGNSVNWSWSTAIVHIDMDCFFVSASLLKHPEMVGKPVAVTHSTKTNLTEKTDSYAEIASCSYEARRFGVKNGTLMKSALKLCPDLMTIPYYFEDYQRISETLYKIVSEFTIEILAVSCDELYVDISSLCTDTEWSPSEIVSKIRSDIFTETGCRASAGIGPNMLMARMATQKAKPNGQFQIDKINAANYLSDINVKDLPGVGRKMLVKLNELGITTCQELREMRTLETLQKHFGSKTGQFLIESANGIDHRSIQDETVRKSISCDVNYGIRLQTDDESYIFLRNLSQEMSNRMRNAEVIGSNVSLKLLVRAEGQPIEPSKYGGTGICDAITRSRKLNEPTQDPKILFNIMQKLYVSAKPFLVADLRGVS